MRALLFSIGLILMTVALGAGVGAPGESSSPAERQWVRTVDGWEPLEALTTTPRPARNLHPLVVTSFQVFASLGILMASDGRR